MWLSASVSCATAAGMSQKAGQAFSFLPQSWDNKLLGSYVWNCPAGARWL